MLADWLVVAGCRWPPNVDRTLTAFPPLRRPLFQQVLRNPLSDSLDEASDHTAEKLRRLGFEPYSQEVS